jgi:FPC/CPF motif-containing protein YcgG
MQFGTKNNFLTLLMKYSCFSNHFGFKYLLFVVRFDSPNNYAKTDFENRKEMIFKPSRSLGLNQPNQPGPVEAANLAQLSPSLSFSV